MFEAYITNTALYPMMGIEVGTLVIILDMYSKKRRLN